MGFWDVPLLWSGKTVFIFGCGPGLTRETVERVKGWTVIAVNNAAELAPWASLLFFNDATWFRGDPGRGVRPHRDLVDRWGGLVATGSRIAFEAMPEKIKLVRFETRPEFPRPGCGVVRHGRSSGHKAVALAVAMGAAKIVLLGFDMREVEGRTHFHNEYRGDVNRYAELFVPGFAGWHEAAQAVGCEIVNATPGSALKRFPFVTLDEVLT